MHRRICFATTAIFLVSISWSQIGSAQKPTCDNITFSKEISDRFPNARDACVDIVERDGRPYAHFQARIENVRGGRVEAQFRAPDGTYSDTIAFNPPADARVRIQGRSYRYSELSQGQELDVYLPPDRWAVAVPEDPSGDFATARKVDTVPLAEPTQAADAAPPSERLAAASLPETAGRLPLIAVSSWVFIGLGVLLIGIASRIRL
ncbi:MAG TPA: hypothetical protein VFV10_12955 [Gammaproteobacteria bacterium]|nr:hypothetical protein [Gammaproteobacteria bacterium]